MSDVVLREVTKQFTIQVDGRSEVVAALAGVSFSVKSGEVVALTGLSGCGKTTALRIIMGLERATSGEVLVGGRRVTGCGYDRGMVFQHAELLPWQSALGNVQFGLEMKGVRGDELAARAASYLELVGLKDSMNRRPHQLSGGMKQRVGIARALAIDPVVLLMDEPFSALDAQTRESLQVEVLAIHQKTGKSIIFVTHDLDEAVLLADRVVLMSRGRVQEIIDVPLPRPRADIVSIRASEAFARTRFRLWKSLHDAGAAVAAC